MKTLKSAKTIESVIEATVHVTIIANGELDKREALEYVKECLTEVDDASVKELKIFLREVK